MGKEFENCQYDMVVLHIICVFLFMLYLLKSQVRQGYRHFYISTVLPWGKLVVNILICIFRNLRGIRQLMSEGMCRLDPKEERVREGRPEK